MLSLRAAGPNLQRGEHGSSQIKKMGACSSFLLKEIIGSHPWLLFQTLKSFTCYAPVHTPYKELQCGISHSQASSSHVLLTWAPSQQKAKQSLCLSLWALVPQHGTTREGPSCFPLITCLPSSAAGSWKQFLSPSKTHHYIKFLHTLGLSSAIILKSCLRLSR